MTDGDGMPKKKKQPANAAAWCGLHKRLMNYVYIRRRGCVMRQCKHLCWLNGKERNYDGCPVNGSEYMKVGQRK